MVHRCSLFVRETLKSTKNQGYADEHFFTSFVSASLFKMLAKTLCALLLVNPARAQLRQLKTGGDGVGATCKSLAYALDKSLFADDVFDGADPANPAPGDKAYRNLPVYAGSDLSEPLGMQGRVVTYLPGGDCIFHAVWSFDFNEETGFYDTQLSSDGTCLGEFNAITGGNGEYKFASGQDVYIGE